MRGKILDTTDLEAFVALDDNRIISIPIYKVSTSNIGDFVFLSESEVLNSGSFRTTDYISPIIRFF